MTHHFFQYRLLFAYFSQGIGIRKRVQEQLIEEKFKKNPKNVEKYMNVKMNYNDCETVWWTGTLFLVLVLV